MTTSKHDMAYGRQGGRIVDWVPPDPPPTCDVCDLPVLSGLPRHGDCEPPAEPNLFDEPKEP